MRQPDFFEIWSRKGWREYTIACRPERTRAYYQNRSIARMLFWIPVSYFALLGVIYFLGLVCGSWN